MIINTPVIQIKNHSVVISSEIKFNTSANTHPATAWFSYPEKYQSYISGRVDAFVTALLPLAMALGEDIQTHGALSPRLEYGLYEYQSAFHLWNPDVFHLVNINCDQITPLAEDQAGNETLAFFSGGVDSCYSLMSHLPENQPLVDYQVRYALFVHGFDIPLQDEKTFNLAVHTFQEELPASVELIPCKTNLHYLMTGAVKWPFAHGGPLIASGLILDGLVKNLIIPASYSLDELEPWGSTPLVDYWLSTETIESFHHGADAERIEKIEAIAAWQPAHKMLRVCINAKERKGVKNCSRCEKCTRTMGMLKMVGALSNFKTFNRSFSIWDFLNWVPDYTSIAVWAPYMMKYALNHRQYQYVPFLFLSNLRGWMKFWMIKMLPRPIFLWLREKKFPLHKSPFHPLQIQDLDLP